MEGGRAWILGGGVTGGSRRGIGRGDSGERGSSCPAATRERAILVDVSAHRRGAGFVLGALGVCLATREWVLIGSGGGGAGGCACQS